MLNLISGLRSLNVLVLHPRNVDADDLIQQLNRIGCSVESLWPLPDVLPEATDVVFVEVKEAVPPSLRKLFSVRSEQRPVLIGLVSYENPSVLSGLLELGVHAVLSKPLRASGVLSSLVVARHAWLQRLESMKAEEKLRLKIEQVNTITQAKFILMRHHGIDENEAYKIIRSHAMARRTSTLDIANAIINADDVLNNLTSTKK